MVEKQGELVTCGLLGECSREQLKITKHEEQLMRSDGRAAEGGKLIQTDRAELGHKLTNVN